MLEDKHGVTVITLTRHRINLLDRAINSVRQQGYSGKIEHLILIDDCLDTLSYLKQKSEVSVQAIVYDFIPRPTNVISGPSRVAKLRNIGVLKATFDRIAFLDDDNEYEPDHVSSLVELMESLKYFAVHSNSRIYYSDGRPYLEQCLPWYRDKKQGTAKYQEFIEQGIVMPGSNIIRSRFPEKTSSNIDANFVDTSEWLIRRELLLRYPFIEAYDLSDWENLVTEDDKLVHTFLRNNIAVASTGKPTVKYFLGGYSNSKLALQKPGEWVLE